MPAKDKDFYRDLKRCIKKRGGKQRRAFLKRTLEDNPEEAHLENDFDFGGYSSEQYNGMDHDATRKKDDEIKPELPQTDTDQEVA
jgi:hypothetical protein